MTNLPQTSVIVALLGALMTAGPCAALSWSDPTWVACIGASEKTVEQRIAACTVEIGSASETPESRAFAYAMRGSAYFQQRDYDHAMADYNEAIALDPKAAATFGLRATVRHLKGDLDGALADYDQSIKLEPEFAFPYYQRGRAYLIKGDLDHAITAYSDAMGRNAKF